LPNLLTVDELKAVMAHAPDHCRWALDVEYNTGCRPGETELLKLKFSDVSWETNEITIRGTKTGERKVSLKPDFMTRLRNAYEKADSDYVITYKGKPIKRLQKSFNTALTYWFYWSGREDLNLRPPAPKAGALPDCATPRHFCCPHTTVYNRSQALTDPFKVRYRRYASALVTAAYNKYASFLHIRKP
jgi:hypothetical protein